MTGSRADSVPFPTDDDETALRAFAAVSALGPSFVAAPVPDMGRVSWAALIDEPTVLQGKGVRGDAFLAADPSQPDVESRVAASIADLGLAARPLSPLR
jgi:hypothetical protein